VSSLVPRLSTPTQEPGNETRRWLAVLLPLTVGLRNDLPPPTAELESSKKELQKNWEELQKRIERKFTG